MSPTRRIAYFVLACNLFETACGEGDECDCADDEECSRYVRTEDRASGDFEILDGDGDSIVRVGGFPTVRFEEESFAIDLANASVTFFPPPTAVGASSVDVDVCDERSERPRCARFHGTLAVTELAPNCGSGACARLAFSLRLEEAPEHSPVSTRGSAFFERSQRAEAQCTAAHRGGCGCSGQNQQLWGFQ
jgi:hypothetical protein